MSILDAAHPGGILVCDFIFGGAFVLYCVVVYALLFALMFCINFWGIFYL